MLNVYVGDLEDIIRQRGFSIATAAHSVGIHMSHECFDLGENLGETKRETPESLFQCHNIPSAASLNDCSH